MCWKRSFIWYIHLNYVSIVLLLLFLWNPIQVCYFKVILLNTKIVYFSLTFISYKCRSSYEIIGNKFAIKYMPLSCPDCGLQFLAHTSIKLLIHIRFEMFTIIIAILIISFYKSADLIQFMILNCIVYTVNKPFHCNLGYIASVLMSAAILTKPIECMLACRYIAFFRTLITSCNVIVRYTAIYRLNEFTSTMSRNMTHLKYKYDLQIEDFISFTKSKINSQCYNKWLAEVSEEYTIYTSIIQDMLMMKEERCNRTFSDDDCESIINFLCTIWIVFFFIYILLLFPIFITITYSFKLTQSYNDCLYPILNNVLYNTLFRVCMKKVVKYK